MRRLLAIALVSLHLFNLFGYMVTFLAARAEIRRELKQRIKQCVPEEELIVIRVTPSSASSLEWIESFEFRYRGGMYDIVRQEQAGDTTIYHCVNDVQEERLFAGLDGLVRRQMQNDGRTSSGASGPPGARSLEYLLAAALPSGPVTVVCILRLLPSLLPDPPMHDVPFPPPKVA